MDNIKRLQQLGGILNENFDPIDGLTKTEEFKKENDDVIMAQGIMEDDGSVSTKETDTKGSVAPSADTTQGKPTSTYNESIRLEIRNIVENLLRESEENIVDTIDFNGEVLDIIHQGSGFENFIYANTEDGEPYADITTNLLENPLTDAVWVKVGEYEEQIANLINILEPTNVTTKSGYNTYKKYNIIK